MGMYDSIDLEMDCPNCGDKYLEFQTKEGHCVLDILEPQAVESFYTVCGTCDAHIVFKRLHKDTEKWFPKSQMVTNSWRFGKHLYRCTVSYVVKSDPKLILKRKRSMIREIEDKILNKK